MIQFRSFRNTDPPVLASIWQSQWDRPGLRQPVSVDLLEQLVFAKLYFDYPGLILAWEDGRAVGFVHAGFGPNEQMSAIRRDYGVICLLMVRPDCPHPQLPEALLLEAEKYLTSQGAKLIYGGGIWPLCPFYLGLYGGSKLPGVLLSDTRTQELYLSHGYREVDRTVGFHCELGSFRMPVRREIFRLRRSMQVHALVDPPPRNWWEACLLANFTYIVFHLMPKQGGQPVAWAMVRDLEPEGSSTIRAMGLVELEVAPAYRRQALATFLICEIIRYLHRLGVETLEAQTMASNLPAINLYQKLGFVESTQGVVFRKEYKRV